MARKKAESRLIFLGLLVAPGGNPIGYEIYEGNIHEGKTLVPVIEDLASKHGFDHPIVVADAGLLSRLERLQKRFDTGRLTKANINRRGYNKYLKMVGDVTITIDMEKYEADAAWDGVKGFVTNTKLDEKEVLASYSNLWFIERAFRMNKGDLRARPIFHRLHNRIEAHICICFTAYTIMLELERLLKAANSDITIYQAGHLTKTMYQLNYQMPRSRRLKAMILQMDSKQQELYDIVRQNSDKM
jgi:transposase